METEAGSQLTDELPAVGAVIGGRYRLIQIIGRGGMGAVYKAEHVHMGKTVALKLLLTNLDSDAQASKRFRQEAQAASQLSHPNIVNIYDFEIDGSRAFLAMDYLPGASLEAVLDQSSPLSLPRFAHIFGQACRALGYAHKQGLVHRDIKPSNLMLIDRADETDVLVIVDFGLVKIMGAQSGGEQKLTSTNMLVGSPLYMSPEQCRGGQIDHRSDIYSLGCVMYRALTGTLPFIGENPLDTLFKHVTEEPRSLRQVNESAAVPPKLEAAIMKALAKDPEGRQQNMHELAADLAQGVASAERGSIYIPPPPLSAAVKQQAASAAASTAGPATTAGAGPAAPVALKPLRKKQSKFSQFLALAGIVGGSIGIGAIVVCSLLLALVNRELASDVRYATMHAEEGKAAAQSDDGASPTPVPATAAPVSQPGQPATAFHAAAGTAKKRKDSSIDRLASTQRLTAEEKLAEDEADSAFDAEDWSKALAAYKRCLEMERRIFGSETNPATLPVVAKLTVCASRLGNVDATVEYLNDFNDLFAANPKPIEQDFKLLTAVASIARQNQNLPLAEDLVERAIAVRQQEGQPDAALVRLMISLSEVYSEEGKTDDADKVLREAVQTAEAAHDLPLKFQARRALIKFLRQTGRADEADRMEHPLRRRFGFQ